MNGIELCKSSKQDIYKEYCKEHQMLMSIIEEQKRMLEQRKQELSLEIFNIEMSGRISNFVNKYNTGK